MILFSMQKHRPGNKKSLTYPRKNHVAHMPARTIESELAAWQIFYQVIFGIELLLKDIKIPKARHGFDRMIVVTEGLMPNQVYALCAAHFSLARHYMNLDSDVVENERVSDRSYAVFLRGGNESDAELKNMSADELRKNSITTITLLEYLLYQLKHFIETGMLLDARDITMCAGSRYKDGRVPTAISHHGELKIHWCAPHEKNPRLRARQILRYC